MTDQPEETNDMPKLSAVTKLPPAEGWLAPILSGASEMLYQPNEAAAAAIKQAGEEIAAGVAQEASENRPAVIPSPQTFDGHTRGSSALIDANRTIIEAAVDDINEEIRLATDEAAFLITLIGANRDDKVARLVARRENALKSAEALAAMQKVLGQ